MHIHGPQLNPYAALDALRSAQKAAAKREAELVRKELMESAAELAGESDFSEACVIKLKDPEEDRQEHQQESQSQPRRRNQKQDQRKQEEPASSEASSNHLSDWA